MTDKCIFCGMIQDKSVEKLFEDDKCVAVLDPRPATPGHVLVMPKEHYPIIEQVPDFLINHVFKIANKISIAAFESLQVQGTNIIVSNGIAAGQEAAHFMISIIPRKENDRVNFQWQPKQLSEEEISTIEMQLKEEAVKIGDFEKEKAEPLDLGGAPEVLEETAGDGENYLIKHLQRIP